jgi:hypothetical protein
MHVLKEVVVGCNGRWALVGAEFNQSVLMPFHLDVRVIWDW